MAVVVGSLIHAAGGVVGTVGKSLQNESTTEFAEKPSLSWTDVLAVKWFFLQQGCHNVACHVA